MTTPLFKKLNLKDIDEIVVLNAPASFAPELRALRGVDVHKSVRATRFCLAFVQTSANVARVTKEVVAHCSGDLVLWFAYPKKSSKKYSSELSRDESWRAVGAAGFEPVRMVAIDEDWSALRFRRAEFIRKLTRDKSFAMSAEGKRRATGGTRAG